MTRISKFRLNNRVLGKLSNLFFEIVAKQKNKDLFEKIIVDILTPTERIMIAKRIAIVYLLMKKIDQRTICGVLKVSSGTVAKFSLLMERSDGLVPQFNKMLKEEAFTSFLLDVFNEIFAPGIPGTNWTIAWQRKKEQERKKLEEI